MPVVQGATNVTLPSVAELEQTQNFDYRLSDFALFSGTLPQQTKSLKAKDPVAYGAVWTNSLAGHHQVFAMSVDNVFNHLTVRRPTFPHAKHIAVAPRFINPEQHGLGTTYYQGKQCLTLNGAVVYFPATMASPYHLPRVNRALIKGQLTPLNAVPYQEYATDHMGIDYSPLSNPYTNYGNFYRFEGQNYAVYCYPNPQTKQNQYYWFICEPIFVEREPDNALQCLKPLFAASYEPVINQTTLVKYLIEEDRNEFVKRVNSGAVPDCRYFRIDPNFMPLGQYLNTGFMNQLAMSTNFAKLDQIQQDKQGQITQDDFMM